MADESDRRFLAAAIRLGEGALGLTWPNPAVGALVVKDGIVLGRGRTARGGRPHAEALALARAGDAARGATLYVSLEPCSHRGRAPPCADAVIAAGVARVVCAIDDPDPRVAGEGFAKLRSAGIVVEEALMTEAGRRAHTGHIRRVASGRPHVVLKLAVSADGAIGRRGEKQVAVTGPVARAHVQALRSRFDAIAVGAGTLAADDPLLTCRLPGLQDRSPVRVLFSAGGEVDPGRRAMNCDAPTWLLAAAPDATMGHIRRLRVARHPDGRFDLKDSLTRLAAEGIARLLVEGGARLARALLEADLVDEAIVLRSRTVLGGDAVPALAGLPLATIEDSQHFRRFATRRLGADTITRYEKVV